MAWFPPVASIRLRTPMLPEQTSSLPSMVTDLSLPPPGWTGLLCCL